MPCVYSVCHLSRSRQSSNGRDQIDCSQNVGTKLTVIPKCRDQNGVFAKKKNTTLSLFIFRQRLNSHFPYKRKHWQTLSLRERERERESHKYKYSNLEQLAASGFTVFGQWPSGSREVASVWPCGSMSQQQEGSCVGNVNLEYQYFK